MLVKTKEIIEYTKCNIISIIILINSFQLVLAWSFKINFNAWIEYGLVFLVLALSKFKIKNIKNLIVISICALIFLLSKIFVNTNTLDYYINQFQLFALPLLIIFLVDIDIKKFLKVFFIYNIVNISLYLLLLFFFSNGIIEDYMTFGYNSIFSVSYIILYAFYNKHYKTMICAFAIIPLIIINGNRGTILVVAMMILLMLLISTKMHIAKKILIFALIMIIVFNINIIAKSLLDFAVDFFDVDMTYSIRNLYSMLDSHNIDDLFGARYDIYVNAINEIKSHPLFGIGVASFHEKYEFFPHNIFLDIYSTFGIIFGTIYLIYIINIGIKLYKISKEKVEVRIIFIFLIANLMKLILSKTFIYDPVMWIYIALGNLVCTKYKELLNKKPKEYLISKNEKEILKK